MVNLTFIHTPALIAYKLYTLARSKIRYEKSFYFTLWKSGKFL